MAGLIPCNETLEELAAMLVEVVTDHERDSELESLTRLTEGIWEQIELRTLAWAEAVEAARDARQTGAAA